MVTTLLSVGFYFWVISPWVWTFAGHESPTHATIAACKEAQLLYQSEGETVSECYAR